jgi:hypothetical protein
MKRFINSNTKNYHHETIESFSDNSRFLVSGSAKGHNTIEYSWLADFLYKNTGNLSLNKHTGYISFIGEADIMYQEYGNVSDLYDKYPFFSYVERAIFSGLTVELSTKQYYKIGQKHAEYDLIEYINISKLTQNLPVLEKGDLDDGVTSEHEFYRAPVFKQVGDKLDLDIGDEKAFYDKYVFATRRSGENEFLGEYIFNIVIWRIDFLFQRYSNGNTGVIEDYETAGGTANTMLDYKVNADNSEYQYFDGRDPVTGGAPSVVDIVMYQNNSEHYNPNSFKPYYGFIKLYDIQREPVGAGFGSSGLESVFNWTEAGVQNVEDFFPEVIIDGKLEPAKTIIEKDYGSSVVVPRSAVTMYTGNSLEDPKDQSRIVYNSCGNMFRDTGSEYKLEKEVSGKTIYSGIDLDTERNRRYSAVVMTEPYFVTVPISSKLVEYSFVFEDGTPVKNWTNQPIFLKIKSSMDVFAALDSELSKTDYNTDVINTLSINDIIGKEGNLLSGPDYYDDFGTDLSTFHERQDDCLDDLIGGVVGSFDGGDANVGTHKKYYIDAFGIDANKYSDDQMKVCGLGIEYRAGTEILKIYCTNYVAVDAPLPGDPSEAPRSGLEFELISNSHITSYNKNELIRPMIKIPGMNGYVKIMRRDDSFKTSRSIDGKHEVVFQVEFPYCPGSFKVRDDMDFVFDEDSNPDPLKMGFIYKKESYINAGSREVDTSLGTDPEEPGLVYDVRNDRFVPHGDDSFTKTQLLHGYYLRKNEVTEDYVKTDRFDKGGKFNGSISSEKSLIKYPRDLVLRVASGASPFEPSLFTLTKPRYNKFRRYGTFEISINDNDIEDALENLPFDTKLLSLVDNRKWKFDRNKFASYIGRENPAYVFEIDIATLSKDFHKFQKDHGAIPDSKRWLYSFFSGFANMLPNKDITSNTSEGDITDGEDSESLTTDVQNYDIPLDDVKSDVILEIWDQESDLGNGQGFYWARI